MLQARGIPPRPISRPSMIRTGFGRSGSQRARPMAKMKPAQTGSCPRRRMAKAKLKAPIPRNTRPRMSTIVIGGEDVQPEKRPGERENHQQERGQAEAEGTETDPGVVRGLHGQPPWVMGGHHGHAGKVTGGREAGV